MATPQRGSITVSKWESHGTAFLIKGLSSKMQTLQLHVPCVKTENGPLPSSQLLWMTFGHITTLVLHISESQMKCTGE